MDFRLLGRLEVSDGDRIVQIGEGRQGSVLAILLLHHDETVPSERIIDALWGEHPPPTAAKVLQNHVAQLRRALGDRPGALLQTHGHGYALHLDGGGFDLERFEELARAGSRAMERDDYAEARTLLEEALALWRGPALADFAYEAFAQPEIARLEERRLTAVEQRLEAELGLGHDHALVPELEGLVAEHPTRERLPTQLMLALYRAGRQADALTVYGQGRQALIDELGVEPGPALRDRRRRSCARIRRWSPRAAAGVSRGVASALLAERPSPSSSPEACCWPGPPSPSHCSPAEAAAARPRRHRCSRTAAWGRSTRRTVPCSAPCACPASRTGSPPRAEGRGR